MRPEQIGRTFPKQVVFYSILAAIVGETEPSGQGGPVLVTQAGENAAFYRVFHSVRGRIISAPLSHRLDFLVVSQELSLKPEMESLSGEMWGSQEKKASVPRLANIIPP